MFGYENFDHFFKTCIYNLKCKTFKMVCLSIYCLLSTGCGKKVKTSDSNNDLQRPGLTASVLQLKNNNQTNAKYTFSMLGDVFFPAKLKFKSGNSNKKAKIYFAKGDPVEELYCLYENIDKSDTDLEFVDCYTETDYDNNGLDDELNYKVGDSIIQVRDHILELDVENDDAILEANLDVEWH